MKTDNVVLNIGWSREEGPQNIQNPSKLPGRLPGGVVRLFLRGYRGQAVMQTCPGRGDQELTDRRQGQRRT